jgi:hypothetical protein
MRKDLMSTKQLTLPCLTVLLSLPLSACLTPRSMTYATTAASIGEGATDVSVVSGFGYQYQANAPIASRDATNDIVTTQTVSRGFALPTFEANVQHGLTKQLALNLHGSTAGLQPGLKWTLTTSKKFAFALLPAIAFGYGSVAGSTFTTGSDGRPVESSPTTNTSFTFLAGLKAIFSHQSGFYIGVGYDLLVNRSLNSVIVVGPTSSDQTNTLTVAINQNIGGAVGFEFRLGPVRLRPELALQFTPVIASTVSTRVANMETSTAQPGGFGWAIVPGLSVGVASPPAPKSEGEEDMNNDETGEEGDEAGGEAPAPKNKYESSDDEPSTRRRRGNDDEFASPQQKKNKDP